MSGEIEQALQRLKVVCESIAGGRYEDLSDLFDMTAAEDLPGVVNDLAESFASMVVQVEAREFRLTETLADLNEAHHRLGDAHKQVSTENTDLRHQVQRLRIEIDTGRRDREVSEIAGTDYFQMLRGRAQDMRSRFRRDSPAESPEGRDPPAS